MVFEKRNRFFSSSFICTLILGVFFYTTGCSPDVDSGKNSDDGASSATFSASSNANAPFSIESVFSALPKTDDEAEMIRRIMASEELIRSLAPRLGQVAKRLSGKSSVAEHFFAAEVSYAGPQQHDWKQSLSTGAGKSDQSHRQVGHVHFSIDSPSMVKDLGRSLWNPILDGNPFEECQFGIEAGEISTDGNQFRMHSLFEGKFFDGNRPYGVKAKQAIDWAKFGSDWKIVRWHQTKFDLISAPTSLFENVTETAIVDEQCFKSVSQSSLEEVVLRKIAENSLLNPVSEHYIRFTDWESSYQYPAVSVVDYDGDGWDDIFLLDRHASMNDTDAAPVPASMMLRNRGDGTFEEATKESGLEISKYGNCAIFADFDNDGDKDAFIGRTLEPSQYFINDGGKYRLDTSMEASLEFTRFVVSASVIDVNRDGLLDLYLCTYLGQYQEWFDEYFHEDDIVPMKVHKKKHFYIDRSGPSNVLLMNQGGRLEPESIGNELKQWRNSYQSAWSDFDGDGDSDVYICNDFSPDAFLRNDTERGSFTTKFTDVSKGIVNDGTMGFGMGATWGDFDRDADLDLYVSNMYSKAGKRIIKQAGKVDQRTDVSSRGNFLYQKNGDAFDQIAGLEEGDVHVSKVGWSFGGQFADFDNDGWLDLYVPSGFFTAPASIRAEVDL